MHDTLEDSLRCHEGIFILCIEMKKRKKVQKEHVERKPQEESKKRVEVRDGGLKKY